MREAEAFQEFHEELKLDPGEVAFASEFPDLVREALSDGEIEVVRSELQGSLKKATAISPLDDVDLFASLSRKKWGDPDEGEVDANAVVETVREVLDDHLDVDVVGFESRRHALRIDLGPDRPHFDLVLGFEIGNRAEDLLIIDTWNPWDWFLSWPRALRAAVADANDRSGGRLVHVVRMIKHGLRVSKVDLPGIAVEGFACRAGVTSGSYAEIAAAFLGQGSDDLDSGTAMEPAGRENLVDRLDPDFVREARDWFSISAEMADQARAAADEGNHNESIRLWHNVFGDPFSRALDADALKAAAAALSFGRGAARPTRAYGDV